QMILAFESNQTCVGNALGEFEASLICDAAVMAAMKHESRHMHLSKPVANIDSARCILETDRILRRRGDAHEFIHPSNLLWRTFGNECRREKLAKRRIVLPPPVKD